MLDRFTNRQVFVAIARRGHFGKGAEDVGVSQAMASKHVKALEKDLGVRLFNRTTRSISLTEAGRIYLERISALLEQIETVEQRVTNQSTAPKGTLTIAAPTSFGAFHLTPVVAAFMDKYPGVEVRLTLADRDVDLVGEGFDLAIYIRDLDDSSYVARRLGAVRMMTCAAPAYLAQHAVPEHPSELTRHNCLIFSEAPVRATAEWLFSDGRKTASIRVTGDLVANRGDALRVAAVAGRGIVRLPGYMVDEQLRAGRLVAMLEDFAPPLRPIHAVYPHRELLPSKVRTFIEYLAAAAPGDQSVTTSQA